MFRLYRHLKIEGTHIVGPLNYDDDDDATIFSFRWIKILQKKRQVNIGFQSSDEITQLEAK